ncbi:hypothetical protein ACFE04_021534 [Oxalis oulophora]
MASLISFHWSSACMTKEISSNAISSTCKEHLLEAHTSFSHVPQHHVGRALTYFCRQGISTYGTEAMGNLFRHFSYASEVKLVTVAKGQEKDFLAASPDLCW